MAERLLFIAGERIINQDGTLSGTAAAKLNRIAELATGALSAADAISSYVAKDTGSANWTAATGTATRATFATGSVTLPALAEHVKALIDDLLANATIK